MLLIVLSFLQHFYGRGRGTVYKYTIRQAVVNCLEIRISMCQYWQLVLV